MPFINRSFRFVIGVGGLLIATIAIGAGAPPTWSIALELTPIPSTDSTVGGMQVEEDIASVSGSLTLRLDTMAPGLERERGRITGLVARDDDGDLSLIGPEASADHVALRWRAARSTRGHIHLSYFMPAALPHPRKRGPHMDLQAIDDGTSGAFGGFLLAPEGVLRATVRWRLKLGRHAVSTLGDGDFDVTQSDADFRRAFFLTGTLQTVPRLLSATGIGVVSLGGDVRLHPAADWFGRAYAAERQAFLAPADARFRILIRSYNGGPFSSGRAARNGFLFYLPQGQPLDTLEQRGTIAHEFVHSLSSNLDAEKGEQGLWYTEGAADYFSLVLPYRAGLYTLEEYLTIARQMTTGYYTNPLRGTTNASLDRLMWSGRVAWNVPYLRGMMYFVDLDSKLRRRHTGITVLDLVNAMTVSIHSGEPETNATWAALLRRRVGAWAISDWKAMLAGRLIVPDGDSFGPCFERHERMTGLFDLGFAKPLAVHDGETVSGVDPLGAAARAGLRDGDVIAETIDINAASLEFNKPLAITVRRGGRPLTIRYDPHGKIVKAYEWRRRPGNDARCRKAV